MKYPYSLGLIAFSLVLYVLQHVPLFGLLAMLLLVPLWSVLLVNAAFVGVIWEVFKRPLPRLWLVLPALWFAGGVLIAGLDRMMVQWLHHKTLEANSRQSVPFDAELYALVAVGNAPAQLSLEHSDLPVLYQARKAARSTAFNATRLVGRDVCRVVEADRRAFLAAGVRTSPVRDQLNRRLVGEIGRNFCILHTREKPELPVVQLFTRDVTESVAGMAVEWTVTSLAMPDGETAVTKSGRAQPRSWIPLIGMGCFLKSSYRSWDCNWGILRGRAVTIGVSDTEDPIEPISRTLGLSQLELWQRTPDGYEDVIGKVTAIRDKAVADELALLDAMIADPGADHGGTEFAILPMRKPLVRPRIEHMVTAMENGLVLGGKGRSNAAALKGLLEEMPVNWLLPYYQRLSALGQSYRGFGFAFPS